MVVKRSDKSERSGYKIKAQPVDFPAGHVPARLRNGSARPKKTQRPEKAPARRKRALKTQVSEPPGCLEAVPTPNGVRPAHHT